MRESPPMYSAVTATAQRSEPLTVTGSGKEGWAAWADRQYRSLVRGWVGLPFLPCRVRHKFSQNNSSSNIRKSPWCSLDCIKCIACGVQPDLAGEFIALFREARRYSRQRQWSLTFAVQLSVRSEHGRSGAATSIIHITIIHDTRCACYIRSCLYVCLSDDNFRKSGRRKLIL